MSDEFTEGQTIKLYGTVDDSIVDGPGFRFAIFTQGCKHDCAGCHNPEAQSMKGGTQSTVEELWVRIKANPLLSGITLTGGEPFEQAEALLPLVRKVREKGLTVWAYSGFCYEDICTGTPNQSAPLLLDMVDVLVDGPYFEKQKTLDLRWRGSANQRIVDVAASKKAGYTVEWEQ